MVNSTHPNRTAGNSDEGLKMKMAEFLSCASGTAITTLSIIFAIAIGHSSRMYHPDYPLWAFAGLILLFLLTTPVCFTKSGHARDVKKQIALMFGIGALGVLIQSFLVVEIVSWRYSMYFYWFRVPILMGSLFAFALVTAFLCVVYI